MTAPSSARAPTAAAPQPGTGASPAARGWSAGASLLLLASIVTMFLAASSAPSPLYALYRAQWGFSALMLTAVFAIYAFTLLAALLAFGRLSDHLGRRPVVLVAMALEMASIVLFHQAESAAGLMAARALPGLATGLATSALSAALIDWDSERGALMNSVAPMIGMGLGSLGTGLLVQWAPRPLALPYELIFAALLLQGLLVLRLRETAAPRPGAWASMRPQVAVPAPARRAIAQILPVNTAQWALGGFYLSLGPSLARAVTGLDSPLLGGALIAALVLPAALAVAVVRLRPPGRVLRGGTSTLCAGLAVTLAGVMLSSPALFFGGTAVAGLGFGSAFNGAMRTLVPLAAPHERGALMSSFFVLSYLAFALPALAAGLAVGHFGLPATALAFGAVLIGLGVTARVSMGRA